MRKCISKEQKNISITLTINPELYKLIIKHADELGINKSKFIQNILMDKLKKQSD